MTTTTDPGPREWLGLAVLCVTVLVVSLDTTALNVALPTLVHDLHPSSTGLQWIADSYILTNAVLLLFAGALGDRLGRRRVFLAGLATFGAASLACALVHSTPPLLVARAILGVGAALMMPSTLAILTSTFDGPHRARAIGVWASIAGIGTSAGPLLGGFLLQHFWWGSVFLINVPIVVIAFIGGSLLLSESRSPTPAPLDPVAVVLSSGGLAALTYAVIVAPTEHWGSPVVLGSLAVSVVMLVAFRLWDRLRAHPLLDVTLFRNRIFSSALGAITASFFVLFGVSYLLSQYIQFVQGLDTLQVGLRFVPMSVATIIASNVAMRCTQRWGLRSVLLTGMVLMTAGIIVMATLTATSGTLHLIVALTLIGTGSGLAVAPSSHAMMGTLPVAKIGAGSGVRSTVQLLGGSFGVAIIGSLATTSYRSHVHDALAGRLSDLPAAARGPVSDQIGRAFAVAPRLPQGLGRRTLDVAERAFVSGLHLSTIVGAVLMMIATGVAAVYIPRAVETAVAGPEAPVGVVG